jgi:UDP-N-acetylmuramoylalanine--D-glutamate ligase
VIPVSEYVDQNIAVFGLGRSGIAAAQALTVGGAEVFAWDDRVEGRDAAEAAGVSVTNIYDLDWSTISALVLSPGIPLTHPEPHPVVGLADAANCAVVGDMELFALARQGLEVNNPIIAVTGTNGKSTTTALIGHLLEVCGRPAAVGGNIGRPVLDLNLLSEEGVYVLEVSSYQIDLTETFQADVAVLLNITPDHLDRHGSMENYVRIKRRLLERQRPRDTAVVGIDDPECARVFTALESRGVQSVTPFSGQRRVPHGTYVEDGSLYDGTGGAARLIADLTQNPAFVGTHNKQNAAAAVAAVAAVGVRGEGVARGLATFPGLAHRQEQIASVDGISFVNDSKATNPVSTARALACYETVYWIAGGRAKDGGFDALDPYLERVTKAYLIGAAENELSRFLDGRIEFERSETLDVAVASAIRDARSNGDQDGVVLLSPACASFDQFRDFEDRGAAFRDLVAQHIQRDRLAPAVAGGQAS